MQILVGIDFDFDVAFVFDILKGRYGKRNHICRTSTAIANKRLCSFGLLKHSSELSCARAAKGDFCSYDGTCWMDRAVVCSCHTCNSCEHASLRLVQRFSSTKETCAIWI